MEGTGIRIVIPSERKWLEFIDISVEAALKIVGVDMPERLSFAVREAFINAMCVAESLNEEKMSSIETQLTVSDECLEIRVLDEGGGLPDNWQEKISNITCEEFIMGVSGRGLIFIKEYMDEMCSEFADDGRHVLIMRKKLGGKRDEQQ